VELADFISQGILEVLQDHFPLSHGKSSSWLHGRPSLQCPEKRHFINIL
jgi:hypothetical protein